MNKPSYYWSSPWCGGQRWAAISVISMALLCSGCGVLHTSFLNPQGPIATHDKQLFLLVVLVMLLVIGPVLLLTPLFAWHYRLGNRHNAFRPKWNFSWPLEFFIWVPPSLIVAGLAVLLWTRTQQLDPYARLPSPLAPLEVQAVALDWKWLFIYPQARIATLNELTIPVGRPIHISLTSGTVMQSLFIPQLAGQIYAMPGMTTQLNLAAARPGAFPGENTQFNGTGFPQDKFKVVAMAQVDYDRWTTAVHGSRQPLDADAFDKLFAKTTEPRPIMFSSVEPGLFERILRAAHTGHSMPDATGLQP